MARPSRLTSGARQIRFFRIYIKRLDDDVYAPLIYEGKKFILQDAALWEGADIESEFSKDMIQSSGNLKMNIPQIVHRHSIEYQENFRGFYT